MTESIVVDASVVVKWYITEKYSEEALKIRDRHVNGEIQLLAPTLLPYEVINALKYSNLYTENELKLAATSLLNYGISLHPVTVKYAEKIVEIAVENNITVYDASYIALSVINNTRMITADEKLIEMLKPKIKKSVAHISEVKDA